MPDGQALQARRLRGPLGFPTPPNPRAREPWSGLSVGLLGGSFNPAHIGHYRVAQAALRQLDLDFVWWLVSPQNPLKSPSDMAPLAHRLGSAWSLIGRNPRMLATDIESRLGTHYTADTLAALGQRFPRTRFVWLMGADNLATIHRWQNWQRIFTAMPIAVFPRAPYTLKAVNSKAARVFSAYRQSPAALARYGTAPAWTWIRFPMQAISATEIRRQGEGWPPAS